MEDKKLKLKSFRLYWFRLDSPKELAQRGVIVLFIATGLNFFIKSGVLWHIITGILGLWGWVMMMESVIAFIVLRVKKHKEKLKNQEPLKQQIGNLDKSKIEHFLSILNRKKFTIAIAVILAVSLFWLLLSLSNDFVERNGRIHKCNKITGNCVCEIGCGILPSLPSL